MSTTTSTLNIILNILKKGTGAKDASKDLGGVEGAADSAGVGLKGLQAQALAAGGILVGFGAICKQVFEFGAEGAQLQRLADAGTSLATSLGGDMDLIVTKVRAASLGMVSNADIIAGANRAMMLGLGADADEMASLMEVAAHRARAMGISTTQAFNDIVTGVGRMSPLILDNLGIIIDSKAAYQNYADSIGVAVSSLDAAQKKQILLNTVLEEGQAQIAAAGGLAIDAAGNIERLSASTANFTDHLKMAVAGPVADFATGLDMILFSTQHVRDAMDVANASVREGAITYEEYNSKLRNNAEVCGLTVDAQGNLIRVIQQGDISMGIEATVELVEANYLLSTSAWEATAANQGQVSAIDGVAMGMGNLAGATEATTESLYDLETGASKVAGAFGELEFDDKQLWNLAMASGASVEALAILAQQLGIASNAEIEATLHTYGLIEAFGEGEISAAELTSGFYNTERSMIAATAAAQEHEAAQQFLAAGVRLGEEAVTNETAALLQSEGAYYATITGTEQLTAAQQLMTEGVRLSEDAINSEATILYENSEAMDAVTAAAHTHQVAQELMAQGVILAEGAMRDAEAGAYTLEASFYDTSLGAANVTSQVGELAGQLDSASASALQVTAALEGIPDRITSIVEINIATTGGGGGVPGAVSIMQHGTPYAPGGPTWVGERGPELVYMPRGARVESAGRSKSIYNQQQYNQGGNTFIINDPMTAAVMMEQAQQQATNNLTGSIM